MKILRFILISSVMLLCGTDPLSARKCRLVWKDDFRGREIDTLYWSRITRGESDWNRYMSEHDALFDLKNGKLIMRAVVNDGVDPHDTASYLTGGVRTKGKFTVGLGKVEVRAKLEGAKSVWPAIWMLPQTGVWPLGGEIDIMERLGHDGFVYQTVHSNYTYVLKQKNNPVNYRTSGIKADSYNVYAVEIHEDRIVFLVNGQETFTYPKLEGKEYEDALQFPFGTPYYILMDMQIGGNWIGPPSAVDLPAEMKIDWIRVYSFE